MTNSQNTQKVFLRDGGWGGEAVVEFDSSGRIVAWGNIIDGMADVDRTDHLDYVREAIMVGTWVAQ